MLVPGARVLESGKAVSDDMRGGDDRFFTHMTSTHILLLLDIVIDYF